VVSAFGWCEALKERADAIEQVFAKLKTLLRKAERTQLRSFGTATSYTQGATHE
jgi:hypothetical protein